MRRKAGRNTTHIRRIAGRATNLLVATIVALATLSLSGVAGALGEPCPSPFLSYPIPATNPAPNQVAADGSGAIWFNELTQHKIGRVAADGTISQFPTPGEVHFLATGPDGLIWYTGTDASNAGIVAKVASDGTINPIPLGASINAGPISLGSDGAFWAGGLSGNSFVPTIFRITTTGEVTTYPIITSPATPNGVVESVTNGPGGALWFTYEGNGVGDVSRVGRINPADGAITWFDLDSNYNKNSLGNITTGSDGALWFVGYKNGSGVISQLTTDGILTEHLIGDVDLNGVAPGPDGNLWAAIGYGIARITLSPFHVDYYSALTSLNYPVTTGIVAGQNNAMWFAEQSGNAIGELPLASVPIVPSPTNMIATPNPSTTPPALSWQAPDGVGSYTVCRDGVVLDTTSSTSYSDNNVVDGTHFYTVVAADGSGNFSAPALGVEILVDQTAPTLGTPTLSVNPLPAGQTTTLSVTAQDTLSSSAQIHVTYSLNGGTPAPMTLQRNTWRATFTSAKGLSTDLPDGVYTITILATDSLGNQSAPQTIVLTVGNPTPTNLTAASPTNQPTMTWDAMSGAASYNIYRDGSSTPVDISLLPMYTDTSNLTDGAHTYSVSAVDMSGNESAQTPAISVVVDKTPPTVSTLNWSTNPLLQGQNTTLSAVVTDNLAGIASVSYSLNGGTPQPMTFNSVTGAWEVIFGQALAVNTYNVEVFATDGVGNQSAPKQDILAVYNAANGYVTGHAKILPGPNDVLPITTDTSNNPAKLIIGLTNIKAATSSTPTSGSFDASYVVKNNKDEFNISSTSVDWLVVPDAMHASIQGRADLAQYVNGTQTTTNGVIVRFDITLGTSGAADHVIMKIYSPGSDPSASTPSWIIDEDLLSSSQVMIHP